MTVRAVGRAQTCGRAFIEEPKGRLGISALPLLPQFSNACEATDEDDVHVRPAEDR
jgi:hypothetical protein